MHFKIFSTQGAGVGEGDKVSGLKQVGNDLK